jgi:DUF4097 and DUF4098 domain-containing protein YvlB
MSEESILILNMLREGKVTAEQADSLLRAVRETAAAAPAPSAGPAPPVPPVPPVVEPDSAAISAMQAKLAELQGKLGDLQGKLGAAQATRTTDYASALAGKILDTLPKPDIDMGKINKAVDEAMRGLNSLKNDAVRTARSAARQASQEARRAGREGRRAIKFEFNFDLGGETASGRPENAKNAPQAVQTSQDTVAWTGADKLALENHHGNITVIGADLPAGTAEATVTKTAWAESESEARILLQQVFLTNQVENGRCKVGIAAPRDAAERLTVDYEIRVPQAAALEVSTTYGNVTAQQTSGALSVQTVSGQVQAAEPFAGAPGETRLHSHSGDIHLRNWNAPTGSVFVETSSAVIDASEVTGETISLTSRSGDIDARSVHAGSQASFEASSGDVHIAHSTAKTRVHLRTQTGQASLTDTQAEQIHIETVSGDAEIHEVAGTLTVKTISGDVEASGADSPAISLVTVSGDTRWAVPTPFSGAFSGTTVSGDLRLTLPSGSDVRVEMNTTSGTLALKSPVTDAVTTDRHAAGTLSTGTGSIRLQSVSGDLVVSEAV